MGLSASCKSRPGEGGATEGPGAGESHGAARTISIALADSCGELVELGFGLRRARTGAAGLTSLRSARDTRAMIRPVLTEVALFLAPFIVYAIFLWATQAGVLHPDAWTMPRIAWLVIVALVLMIGSFVVLAHWGGSPPGSTYVPAHTENGQFVPGETK
jgi:fatty acid desaturase